MSQEQTQSILMDPSEKQRIASTPAHSVWVDASAGTGKTKVLTDRVLRFLLQGIAPSKILCLTFTKAAAAEMQHRVLEKLSSWSTCSRQDLISSLTDLLGQMPSPKQTKKSRILFFELTDDPYGLKILTIHSFCQQILTRFPVEADLPIKSSLIDQDEQNELLQKASDKLISLLDKDLVCQKAFDCLTPFYRPQMIPLAVQKIILEPKSRRNLSSNTLEQLIQNIEKHFKISKDKSAQNVLNHYSFNKNVMQQSYEALKEGSKTDKQQASRFKFFITQDLTPTVIDRYFDIFFTKTGSQRKTLATQKTFKNHPWLQEFFNTEIEKVTSLKEELQTLEASQVSHALTVLSHKLLSLYEDLKSNQSVLDFDDIISISAKLLAKNQGVSWVLYKLDGGVDHILVDEAQDTSPDQWQIILNLVEDFFAGDTSSRLNRTLFVVGDRKQSIYSFQGAEPDLFQHLRHFFQKKIEGAQKAWSQVSLDVSFRSCKAILSMVDDVFKGLSTKLQDNHESFRELDGGRVQLWPLIPYKKETGSQDIYQASPSQQLATKIAHNIKERLRQKELIPAKGRPVKAGDFLILVQRRSAFMYQVIRSLKRLNIPVAGPDRFALMEHIAIKDLMALASFLLLPEDDYSLACVLKSPLFNYSEKDLIDLSCERKQKSLWLSVCSHPDNQETCKILYQLFKKVDYCSPYALFSYVLTVLKGRQKFRARLSDECDDVLDEFLNLAFTYDQDRSNGLQGFVEYCQKTNPDVKRDFSSATLNAVRIMTVHGAKGLQAPIVFLPDTTRVPNQYPLLLWHQDVQNNSIPLWRIPSYLSCEKINSTKDQEEERQMAEYYRLLYVALTRAEDELIIAGWETLRETSDQCWYHIVEPTLRKVGYLQEDKSYIYDCPQQRPISFTCIENNDDLKKLQQIPEWLFKNPSNEIGEAEPLSPSAFYTDISQNIETADNGPLSLLQEKSMDPYREGNYIHKLLEVLPTLSQDQWKTYAKNLARQLEISSFEKGFNDVKSFLENPEFSNIFGSNSYAEVSISGETQGEKFNGQIDRLIITDSTITIIDFKSNKIIPKTLEDTPKSYLSQLFIYKELVQAVYPNHKIRCELIWIRAQKRVKISNLFLSKVKN